MNERAQHKMKKIRRSDYRPDSRPASYDISSITGRPLNVITHESVKRYNEDEAKELESAELGSATFTLRNLFRTIRRLPRV